MNIRLKTETEQVVDIMMKLSEEDRKTLMDYIHNHLMAKMPSQDLSKSMEDPYWPTQGCEA